MQINLTEEMVGTNLNDYHYYIVKKINNTYLELYYSDSRFYSRVNASDGAQAIQGGARTIVVGINLNNAIIGINFSDLVSNSMIMNINQCVATNQNIYYGGSVIIYKNCGYEYDEENETEETCDELVKIKVNTNAHKKPGIEYDPFEIKEGTIVKRIKKAVNEYGYVWDKIELCDGRALYIDTQQLEQISKEDAKEIKFLYNDTMYNIYLSLTEFGADMNNYHYYLVKNINNTNLELYYSDRRFYSVVDSNGGETLNGGSTTIIVNINLRNGLTEKFYRDLVFNYLGINVSECVATNQDIYYGNKLIFKTTDYMSKYNEHIKLAKAYLKYYRINNFNEDINDEYTEGFSTSLKVFQSIMRLVQTGDIDNATFNAMQFNDSNNYNTFLKIIENYNVHKNPYGPMPYTVEKEEDQRYAIEYELGRTKAEYDDIDYCKKQESRFNCMTEEEREKKREFLDITATALYTLGDSTRTLLPEASKGLMTFLSMNIDTEYSDYVLTEEQVNKLFNNLPNDYIKTSKYLEHTAKAITSMLTVDKLTTVSMIRPLLLEAKLLQSPNWFLLLQHYQLSIEGECLRINGNNYMAKLNCYIRDYYDFDKVDYLKYYESLEEVEEDEKRFGKEDVVLSRVADLHYAGMARFYYIEGKSEEIILDWKINEKGEIEQVD